MANSGNASDVVQFLPALLVLLNNAVETMFAPEASLAPDKGGAYGDGGADVKKPYRYCLLGSWSRRGRRCRCSCRCTTESSPCSRHPSGVHNLGCCNRFGRGDIGRWGRRSSSAANCFSEVRYGLHHCPLNQ